MPTLDAVAALFVGGVTLLYISSFLLDTCFRGKSQDRGGARVDRYHRPSYEPVAPSRARAAQYAVQVPSRKESSRVPKGALGKEVDKKGSEERLKKVRLDAARQRGERDALKMRAARPHQHHDDPYYTDLRRRAKAAGDAMARSFEDATAARQKGERGLATNYAAAGVQRRDEMEGLNAQASAWIFTRNNEDSPAGSVDLHGLYVNEACYYVTLSLQNGLDRSIMSLKFIVGRGNHSVNGVAKIKPAVEELLRSRNLAVVPDPRNPGALDVRL